ncbi:MAG: argininosuccinate lyase [Cyclobacteriaceae bacterium]|nr:argininosuccinate lyase [Cyclobacteriaceae bacterium]MDW8330498.1 argininosuccinate lyase [Cyclobacteriaceae bacterium]
MKLWQKHSTLHPDMEKFTAGRDREFDLWLAPWDVIGSLAHVIMLGETGLLTPEETRQLVNGLRGIYQQMERGEFVLEAGVEDVHSQVELMLTRQLGEVGKKIHTGRSRNDQVLTDIRLFVRYEIQQVVQRVVQLAELLLERAERHKDVIIPGYTHSQPAMPSSFGLWFSAWAESLVDDLIMLEAAWRIINKNPLGSAAGYGTSFPLNRRRTTELLGFDNLNYNVVYAQMGRGKTERVMAVALAQVAATLARLSADVILFVNPQFGLLRLPDALTTGSSIMPHKKNPDGFELVRAYANRLQALPNTVALVCANLMSGYHRDYQILKEELFPAFRQLEACLNITHLMLSQIEIMTDLSGRNCPDELFSVEEVNRRVMKGVPFRDAYQQVKDELAAGTFKPDRTVAHTHEGSAGNLCLPEIRRMMEEVLSHFDFAKAGQAVEHLLKRY